MTLRSIKLRTVSKRSDNIVPIKIHHKVNLLIDNWQQNLVTVRVDGEIVVRILDPVYAEIGRDQGIDLGRLDKDQEVHVVITIGRGE